MNQLACLEPDGMQVCRNGHVITDLLQAFPELARTHCERCGAVTLDRCLTCGQKLMGAIHVPEMPPVGTRPPPAYCSACGAAFPWTRKPPSPTAQGTATALDDMLRRVPEVIRQLRTRCSDRPPFQVQAEHDLEDLVRALLPLRFDTFHLEGRTPRYAAGTRTDFRVGSVGVSLLVKLARTRCREPELTAQILADIAYYRERSASSRLIVFIYDPEMLLHDAERLETEWSRLAEDLPLRIIIAS